MKLLTDIPFVKRAIVFVDADNRETIEIYHNRLVPTGYAALYSWLHDFVDIVLDNDSDYIVAFDSCSVRSINGKPTPCVVVAVDCGFEKGVRYD